MFLGEYEHTIDAKGRLAVPAKFRAQMDKGAVISKGMGTCLSVYTMERWEEKSAELASGKTSDELRDFERRIYPSASEVELDSQGRMVIPAKLRAYADLANEVTVAGVRDHFEIWDRTAWYTYQERLDAEGTRIPF
jgi:MraZ protein